MAANIPFYNIQNILFETTYKRIGYIEDIYNQIIGKMRTEI